jgi:ribose transport system permease protein
MSFSPSRSIFFSQRNVHQILLQVGLLSIFAIGETVVIITGGIDLSLGSLIAFSGMLLALMVNALDSHTSLFPLAAVMVGLILTLLTCIGLGAWHSALIHRVRLPAFVITLVSLLVLRSQSLIMNSHQQIPVASKRFPLFDWLANGKIPEGSDSGLPVPILLLAVIGIIVHIILTRTQMGRYLYSVGSNEQATELSGVNVAKVKLFAYGLSALLGGVAGVLYMGYGGQGDPTAGQSYELYAVAAAVVGGASLTGGQGSVPGTILGACLLNTIRSVILLTLAQPDLWNDTVVGGVLMLAVLTTVFQGKDSRAFANRRNIWKVALLPGVWIAFRLLRYVSPSFELHPTAAFLLVIATLLLVIYLLPQREKAA